MKDWIFAPLRVAVPGSVSSVQYYSLDNSFWKMAKDKTGKVSRDVSPNLKPILMGRNGGYKT